MTAFWKQPGLYYSLLKGPVQKGQKLGKVAAQTYRKGYFRSKPLLHVAQTKETMEYNRALYLPLQDLR